MMRDPASVLDRPAGECADASAAASAPESVLAYADGVRALIGMREELLAGDLDTFTSTVTDHDLRPVLAAMFDPAVLELRVIDGTSSAALQDHLIRHEAVHGISDRDELRRRLQPSDRRCFGLFHPALPDEPVIFTEIALTREPVSSMAEILASDRPVLSAESVTTAVFYSISAAQPGLRGMSFGAQLIERAVTALIAELPDLETFVTLSPIPGLRRWLTGTPGAPDDLRVAAEEYVLRARRADGRPDDPVARFHLGNGAQLADIRVDADPSPRGLRQSFGVMASYRYERPAQ